MSSGVDYERQIRGSIGFAILERLALFDANDTVWRMLRALAAANAGCISKSIYAALEHRS